MLGQGTAVSCFWSGLAGVRRSASHGSFCRKSHRGHLSGPWSRSNSTLMRNHLRKSNPLASLRFFSISQLPKTRVDTVDAASREHKRADSRTRYFSQIRSVFCVPESGGRFRGCVDEQLRRGHIYLWQRYRSYVTVSV